MKIIIANLIISAAQVTMFVLLLCTSQILAAGANRDIDVCPNLNHSIYAPVVWFVFIVSQAVTLTKFLNQAYLLQLKSVQVQLKSSKEDTKEIVR